MRPGDRRRPFLLLLSLVAFVLVLAACSSGGGDSDDAGGANDADFQEGAVEDVPAPAKRDALDDSAARSPSDGDYAEMATSLNGVAEAESIDRKIIAKGNVSLESDDVAAAVFNVQAVADRYFGEITERETTTNDDGDISTARLLLRIPVADFDDAFTGLEDVRGTDLQSSSTGKEDVTTKVIDTQVRIRAQRRSLARVEALFDRAQSISDIIRIESQVSRRQADLESLERRLNYLKDQTSMSTISVNISLPPKEKTEKKEKKEPEEAGFFAGLEDGWNAFKDFSTDVSTLAGKVLPFAAALLIIGGPLWLLVRRFRRRSGDAPVATADAGA